MSHSDSYLNLLDSLRIVLPRLYDNFQLNHVKESTLEKMGMSGVFPTRLPKTDDEYLGIFFELATSYQMKKEDRFMSPDMLLAVISFNPFVINREEILKDIQMLFVLFESNLGLFDTVK